jgi:hypothetical protein
VALTEGRDVLDLTAAQRVRLEQREPAVGVGGRQVAHLAHARHLPGQLHLALAQPAAGGAALKARPETHAAQILQENKTRLFTVRSGLVRNTRMRSRLISI